MIRLVYYVSSIVAVDIISFDVLCLISRYVLVTAGPVFTEEMWRLACCALQDAFSATLEPVKVTVIITFTEASTVQTSCMSFDKKLFFVTSVSAKSFSWKQLLRQGCQTLRPAELSSFRLIRKLQVCVLELGCGPPGAEFDTRRNLRL